VTGPDRSLVLVVDDDPAILPLMEAILEDEPVLLEGADGGLAALARIEGGLRPDLLILDVMMPGMGGIEVLHRVKARPEFEQVPVILLTARSRSEDVVVGLEAGATDYVVKPFHLAELKARVRSALRLRALFLELEKARDVSVQRERLRVLVETAGGIAHALNQPLTAALLKIEALSLPSAGGPARADDLDFIRRSLEKVASEVRKIQRLTTYRTTGYPGGIDILDLEAEP
jgi:DNA-binding response OmpR family regulator